MAGAVRRQGISLRAQLMLRFICISLIPVVVISLFSLWCISYFGLQERTATENANLIDACSQLDSELMYARVVGIRATQSADVLGMLRKADSQPAFVPDTNERHLMRSLLMNLIDENKVHSMYVYDLKGNVYTSQPSVLLDWEKISDYYWFREGMEASANFFWGESLQLNHMWVLPYVRKALDMDTGELLGYVVCNFQENVFNGIHTAYGELFILSEKDTILSSSDGTRIGESFRDGFDMDISADSVAWHGKTGHYAILLRSRFNGFRLARVFSYNSSPIINRMIALTCGVALLCALLCAILSKILAARFVQPLQKIRERVDALQLGSSSEQMHPRTNDEIGMLMDSFNNMSTRLESSLAEVQQVNEMRRRAEYRAIELQINPHFLYNTLSLINYLVDAGETEKVKMVSQSLSTMFRISVNRGRELVRISDEISHLRCYMDILSIRHQGEFRYVLDIDPAILEFYTIKIILQPIVENAIQHGIRDNMISDGFIRVNAERSGDHIIFEIQDNGDTPQSRIDEMNHALEEGDGPSDYGIGMRNVHNRIRMYFKGDYGLHYEKRGIYTVARIEIPILTMETGYV